LFKSGQRQQSSLQGSDSCTGKDDTNDYDDKHCHDAERDPDEDRKQHARADLQQQNISRLSPSSMCAMISTG